MALTNQNYVHEEVKNKRNLGNACYHLVQNCLPSCVLSISILTYSMVHSPC